MALADRANFARNPMAGLVAISVGEVLGGVGGDEYHR